LLRRRQTRSHRQQLDPIEILGTNLVAVFSPRPDADNQILISAYAEILKAMCFVADAD
jgi:hypothetical protein